MPESNSFRTTGTEQLKGILAPEDMASLQNLAEDCIGDKPAVRITGNAKLRDLLRPGSTMNRIALQCADVHTALLSVSRFADQGYECTLGKLGGVLRDVDIGDLIPLHRRDNLYVMRARLKQDYSGFARPK